MPTPAPTVDPAVGSQHTTPKWAWAVGVSLQLAAGAVGAAGVLGAVGAAAQGAVRGIGAEPRAGRIEGTAALAPRLTTRRLRVRVYAEPGVLPPSTEPDSNPLANVVLYLESIDRPPTAPGGLMTYAINQRGERFSPHVLPVRVGSIVEFPNDDPIYHNVFSLSSTRTFDLGRYRKGESKSVAFQRAGIVQIFCHIHADMSAYVLVFDHPYFVVPDAEGRFAFEGVPAGEYQLVAWHERIRPFTMPVRVDAGQTATVQVRIPVPDAP